MRITDEMVQAAVAVYAAVPGSPADRMFVVLDAVEAAREPMPRDPKEPRHTVAKRRSEREVELVGALAELVASLPKCFCSQPAVELHGIEHDGSLMWECDRHAGFGHKLPWADAADAARKALGKKS